MPGGLGNSILRSVKHINPRGTHTLQNRTTQDEPHCGKCAKRTIIFSTCSRPMTQ